MENKMSLVDIVSAWKTEAGIPAFKGTVAIHDEGDTLYIVTRHPCFFEGEKGKLLGKYMKVLKENGYRRNVKFVDLFMGDVKQF